MAKLIFITLTIITILVPIIFGAILTTNAPTYCENNEIYFDGACYDFVNSTSPAAFSSAQDVCASRGAGKILAKITSAGVQSFLANSAEMRAWNRALFGLRLTRDKWMWAKDGSMLSGQGCYIDNTEKRDLNISTQFMYSLKAPDCVDYCRTQPTARFAGIQAGRQCFCGSDYGTLPPTTNCNTPCGGDINTVCGGQGANYIYAIDGAYSVWEDGRPANEGGCGAIVLGKRALFPWRDVQCSSRLAHICQFDDYRDITDVSAYFCLYTACYALYDLQKPWYAARAHCQMLGGDLVKIDTVKVHSEIVAMLSDHIYMGLVWIGASNGKWSWSDGALVGDYTSWSSYNSQPVVESPLATCAELSSSETNYNWVARDCGALLGRTTFICQRPSSNSGVVPRSSHNVIQSDGFSSPVVYDPQTQQSENGTGVAYGVVWYGWLLIGLMIGLVMCIALFTLFWAFCMRKSGRSSKLGSSMGSRATSAHSKKSHVCHRHRGDGGTSSGIGSSVNSTASSTTKQTANNSHKLDTTNNTVSTSRMMVDETTTDNHSRLRPCGHEYRDNNNNRDVVTVTMAPGTASRMRVNSGNRSSSETRAASIEREPTAGAAGSNEMMMAGRRRIRKRSETRVGPSPSGNNNNTSESALTPRDPFSVAQDDRV